MMYNLRPSHSNRPNIREQRRNRSVNVCSEIILGKPNAAFFKSAPCITPAFLLGHRIWPGRCCTCMPHSKKKFFDDASEVNDFHNLLDVSMEKGGLFQKWVPYLHYASHRRTVHEYPSVMKTVLGNPKLLEAIEQHVIHNSAGEERLSVEQKIKFQLERTKNLIKNMQANVSNYLLRFAGWFLLKFLGCFLSSVLVHKGQLKMVEKATESGLPVIFLPTHRSHLDYILVTLVLFCYNLPAPHIAAGENLRMPIFSFLMRGLGGFFIRRKLDKAGGKDIVYRSMLQSYIEELLMQKESLEFFIEGGRTRSGKAMHPKAGLLSVVVDSLTQGKIDDIFIVPVSISYDCLLEGNFAPELMGVPKTKETFWRALLGVGAVFCSHYGSVQINFAQPFLLTECLEALKANTQQGILASPVLDSPTSYRMVSVDSFGSFDVSSATGQVDYRHLIQDLGKHVIYSCASMESLMSTQLVSFILLYRHRDGASRRHLAGTLHWLADEVIHHGHTVGYSGTVDDVLEYALTLLHQNIVYEDSSDDTLIKPVTSLPDIFHLTYCASPVTTMFALESVVATALCSKIAESLQEHPHEDMFVTKSELWTGSTQLISYLHYEYVFFPPCQTLDANLKEVCDQLINANILILEEEMDTSELTDQERKWATRFSSSLQMSDDDDDDDDFEDEYENRYHAVTDEETYKVNIRSVRNRDKIEFLKGIIRPLIDTYYVTAVELGNLTSQDILEEKFVAATHRTILQLVECGACLYSESSSLDTIRNAVLTFERIGILERYKEERNTKTTLGLAPKYKDPDLLADIVRNIESFR